MLKSLIKKTSVAIPAFALTLMGVTALAGGRGEVQSYESTRSARTIERSVPDSTVAISAEPATLEELLASRTQGARWLKSVQKSDGGWGAGHSVGGLGAAAGGEDDHQWAKDHAGHHGGSSCRRGGIARSTGPLSVGQTDSLASRVSG